MPLRGSGAGVPAARACVVPPLLASGWHTSQGAHMRAVRRAIIARGGRVRSILPRCFTFQSSFQITTLWSVAPHGLRTLGGAYASSGRCSKWLGQPRLPLGAAAGTGGSLATLHNAGVRQLECFFIHRACRPDVERGHFLESRLVFATSGSTLHERIHGKRYEARKHDEARKHAPSCSCYVVQNHGVKRLLAVAIPLEAHVRAAVRSRIGSRLSTTRSGSGALQSGVASCHARPQFGDVSCNLCGRGRRTLLHRTCLSAHQHTSTAAALKKERRTFGTSGAVPPCSGAAKAAVATATAPTAAGGAMPIGASSSRSCPSRRRSVEMPANGSMNSSSFVVKPRGSSA